MEIDCGEKRFGEATLRGCPNGAQPRSGEIMVENAATKTRPAAQGADDENEE